LSRDREVGMILIGVIHLATRFLVINQNFLLDRHGMRQKNKWERRNVPRIVLVQKKNNGEKSKSSPDIFARVL